MNNPNLRECPVCKHQIAVDARTCPGCGKTFTTPTGIIIAIVIGIPLGLIALTMCTRNL